MEKSEEFVESCLEKSNKRVTSAVEKLEEITEFTKQLLPQIKEWMKRGKVATEKLLHCGITEARAIVKNKVGKKAEFGLKWLINRIGGGDVVGARADERKMPILALKQYREVFGKEATPLMSVYDRAGSHAATEKKLKKEGVQKVAIQPKGQAEWSVAGEDQKEAISQRGKTEGVIGTLKSGRYEFNGGRQRTNESLKAAGHRSMFAMNITNFLRDLMEN